MNVKSRQKFKYLENEKRFKMKQKAFSIIFKRLSLKQIKRSFFEKWKSDFNYCKFETHGFDNSSLKLFHSCFWNRKERVKIGSAEREWIDILTGKHSCDQVLSEWHFRKVIYHNNDKSRSHPFILLYSHF